MSNLESLTQAAEKKRAELAKIEAEIQAEQEKSITSLPKQFGLETIDELIRLLAGYASPRMKALLAGSTRSGSAPRPAKSTGDESESAGGRKRARITDEIKAEVKKLTEGGKTGAEIAAAVGISLPSVANIKRELGLTKSRGK